jgi:1,4-dihydroxy-2-naphthoate octaprenyltransferase
MIKIKIIEKINLWRAIARDYTLSQTLIPYFFAILLAVKNYQVDYFLSFLGLVGVMLVHMSVNILDDYFDWKSGAVEEYKRLINKGEQAKTHKCFYLEEGLTSHKSLLKVALTMDFVAVLLGFYIFLKVGFAIIIIALITALIGFFYSAPPFRLSYRGLSELAIGIVFGPLLLSGAYITAGGKIDATILFASIIVGILVANVSFTHCIMDFKSDSNVGKTSLATLLKSPQNAIILLSILYVTVYLLVLAGIYLNIFPFASVLTFIMLPVNAALIKLMKNSDKTKKFWMGPLGNWDYVVKEGSDWFMLRLCLSRNISAEFIIILGLTYYFFK